MKKEIRLLPHSLRAQAKGNLTIGYYLIYDDNTKRHITISGPYKNFKEVENYPERMRKIFNILFTKSGYSLHNGKIYMTYSDFLNFEFQKFPNLTIENVLM